MASFEGLALDFLESERSEVDLGLLVTTYSPLLYRVVNSILRSRTDSEDVVQDAFLRVLQRRDMLTEVRDMRVWLVRIAWNLALSKRRHARTEQMDDMFAEALVGNEVPADRALDEAQRMKDVIRELERLPKAEHHVLLLAAIEELGTAEIAAVLSRSESAVRALLFRARSRLRERLETKEANHERR